MQIARVLTTMICKRHCKNCCNTYKSIIDGAVPAKLTDLATQDIICLTGGEPMLYPVQLYQTILKLRKINPVAKIFMYSAKYNPAEPLTAKIVSALDGIHFTLHSQSPIRSVQEFHWFQEIIVKQFRTKSFRLYIDPGVKYQINILPTLWKRVEIKPWMLEGECPLPKQETLYRLTPGLEGL